MRILVVNTGSSSVQLQLVVASTRPASPDDCEARFSAKIEDLKGTPKLVLNGDKRPATSNSHADGALELLTAAGDALASIDLVAHRVVHGGSAYSAPTRIDDAMLRTMETLDQLAPLHNTVARRTIETLRERLRKIPHVAVFDTAFHASLPEVAATYAIAPALAKKHGIRRYGFHGTAYRYMVGRYARSLGIPLEKTKLVAVHLGGGCSAAAVAGGRSVETSMGMTPLEGLVMGTRAGDIDPGVIELLAQRENLSTREVIDVLNRQSGLRALSETTEDTRLLVKASPTDARARLALEVFCHRIVKYVGAYLAVLGGADALLLGGVINENTPWVRERVCRHFTWCGLSIDTARNVATIDRDGRITSDDSRLHAWVIPAREDLQLAYEAACLVLDDKET